MRLLETIAERAPELCNQFGIRRLSIFGSVARGDESNASDIDFLAEFDAPTPETMADRYFGFIDAASRLFERPVQLVTPRMLRNPHFVRSLERDLVTVHE